MDSVTRIEIFAGLVDHDLLGLDDRAVLFGEGKAAHHRNLFADLLVADSSVSTFQRTAVK